MRAQVREAAMSALAMLAPPALALHAPAVVRCLEDGYSDVREAAKRAFRHARLAKDEPFRTDEARAPFVKAALDPETWRPRPPWPRPVECTVVVEEEAVPEVVDDPEQDHRSVAEIVETMQPPSATAFLGALPSVSYGSSGGSASPWSRSVTSPRILPAEARWSEWSE